MLYPLDLYSVPPFTSMQAWPIENWDSKEMVNGQMVLIMRKLGDAIFYDVAGNGLICIRHI